MGKTKTAIIGESAENNKKQVVETETTSKENTEGKRATKNAVVEKIRSKNYQAAKGKIDHSKLYKTKDAVKLIKEASYSKFDGTLELHIVVKKVGQSAQVTLPYKAGKEKIIEIADENTLKKLQGGKIDFDILVATPAFMAKLVPFAKILGPKGLMPNPKNGTLVQEVAKAKNFSSGGMNIKTEKEAPLIHTVIGKVSQKDEEVVKNIETILKALGGGKQIVRAFLKSTMSPSIKLEI